jgi:protein O-GlcNAc transferase
VRAFEAGQLTLAQAECEQVLRLDPHHAEALHVRGLIAFRQGALPDALDYVKRALKKAPRTALFLNSLGIIRQAMNQAEEAEAAYRAALRADPACASAAHNLGDVLEAQGRWAEAAQCYQQAIRHQPNFPEALNNLGALLIRAENYADAARHLSAAIRLRPDYAKAHYHLARALRALGRRDEAQAALQQTVKLNPALAEGWHDLGLVRKEQGAAREAVAAFEESVRLNPALAEGYLNLGNIFYELGLADKSREYFEQAQAVRPSDALKVRSALSLPGCYDSREQMEEARSQLEADLDRLMAEELRIDDPNEEVALTPFFLAYQGKNDVRLLSRVAELFLKACPALGYVAPHCREPRPAMEARRIEIGFISSYFGREHIINRSVSGMIAKLPRDHFRVTLLHLDGPCAEILGALRDSDRLVKVPFALAAARARIAAEKLDILFYTDLGLEPWTYFLSFARLARVQCTCGGHPVTSGVPNVDYYISSSLDEAPQAREHYREQLALLPHRPVCYYPAAVAELNKTRADFGLSDERRVYLCPMTPFKLHPETDELFGRILRADPAGEIVFVLNHQRELWQRLQARFARTIPDAAPRLRYLPFQSLPDFVALLRLADVILDTPAFNGGTTSLEALAVGTPMVTLPGEFFRQRATYGLYQLMGLLDCVARDADDYVRLALEIARNPERRAGIQQQILARNQILFGQETGIRELSSLLRSLLEAQR